MQPRRDKLAGIYVHIPFCDRVCPYCDFAVTASRVHDHDAYVSALLEEGAAKIGLLKGRDVQTLYLGGGTPSRLERGALERLMESARAWAPGALEITMEANPQDVSEESVAAWQQAGISRVSLGAQSFQDATLAALGRNHSGAQAFEAARRLTERPGMRVSLDLIYGTPAQDVETWGADLEALSRLDGLEHVSLYQLTIEPGTPFARRAERGTLGQADEQGREALEALTAERLGALGFERYEVSSWGRAGAYSRHNALYWRGGEWLGLGVGAHGAWYEARGPVRSANPRQIKAYMADPVGSAAIEVLTGEEALAERVFANMRTRLGLELDVLREQAQGVAKESWRALLEALDRIEAAGWAERRGELFAPTARGLDLGDTAASWIWDALVR